MEAVELWLVDLDRAAAALLALEAISPRLSGDDLERLSKVTDATLREGRRVAHIALRILLERTFGEAVRERPLSRSPQGRPSLPGTSGDFSLSHTRNSALIGLSRDGPIGVDLEETREVLISQDRRLRIQEAGRALNPSVPLLEEPSGRLLQCWVRLEAVAKAEGAGIGEVLTRLGVTRSHARGSGEEPVSPPSQLAVHDLAAGPGRYGAAAMSAGRPCPPLSHFPVDVAAIEALVRNSA
jgi:4'-phosphopantetheinyl transferase